MIRLYRTIHLIWLGVIAINAILQLYILWYNYSNCEKSIWLIKFISFFIFNRNNTYRLCTFACASHRNVIHYIPIQIVEWNIEYIPLIWFNLKVSALTYAKIINQIVWLSQRDANWIIELLSDMIDVGGCTCVVNVLEGSFIIWIGISDIANNNRQDVQVVFIWELTNSEKTIECNCTIIRCVCRIKS